MHPCVMVKIFCVCVQYLPFVLLCTLMINMPCVRMSADGIGIYFFVFSQKIWFDMSCKLTNCMKCQTLLSVSDAFKTSIALNMVRFF